jgi:hypothetical protein
LCFKKGWPFRNRYFKREGFKIKIFIIGELFFNNRRKGFWLNNKEWGGKIEGKIRFFIEGDSFIKKDIE